MRCGLFVTAWLCVVAASLSAAEITGQIGAVDEQGVAVLISGAFEPQPGDKFVVLVDVPGVGEASIAQGQVSAIDEGIVLGKIVAATGKVAVGQKVKIDSPQAAPKRPAQARIVPGWGDVVDPAGDCQFVATGGRLAITVPGTLTAHDLDPRSDFNNLFGPRVLREVEGDFQLQVKVRPYALPNANTTTSTGKERASYISAGLLVWLGDKTFVKCQRAANGERGEAWVHLQAYQDAKLHKVTLVPGNARNVNKDQATYLRVERNADQLTFSTSVDAKKWALIGIVGDLELPRKLRVGVGIVNATTKDFSPEFEELMPTSK